MKGFLCISSASISSLENVGLFEVKFLTLISWDELSKSVDPENGKISKIK